MKREVIIIGFSNPTPEGVVLHTNIPATLKTGNIQSKEMWVSWDKIGASLFYNYTTKTLVDELDALRAEFKSQMPPTTPTSGVSLISMERSEQIHKHHMSIGYDQHLNNEGQLPYAAAMLANPSPLSLVRSDTLCCPKGWDKNLWLKMLQKPFKDRVIIAGALLAAELDRIQASEP